MLPVQILVEVKSDFKMNKQIFIIYENDELNLLEDSDEKQLLSAPCSEFGGG